MNVTSLSCCTADLTKLLVVLARKGEKIYIMSRITVSTCGTSILTNVNRQESKFIFTHANDQLSDYSPEDLAQIQGIINSSKNAIQGAGQTKAADLSAELNGLIKYYKREGRAGNFTQDTHYLIHTDTFQGEEAAKLVAELGRNIGINFILQKVDDLRTDDIELFRLGVNNLINWCNDTLSGVSQYTKVIFNLVGGFKALQGYMQTLGMFYADETIYIFERSTELLSIPKLPVGIQTLTEHAKDAVIKHLQVFRKIDVFKNVPFTECEGVPETMLTILNEKCDLSVWGRLIWNNLKEDFYRGKIKLWDDKEKNFYSTKLLPPLHEKIKYSEKMKDMAKDLDGINAKKLNSQIDLLAQYLESGKKFNPNSLDYKKLNTPYQGYSYEFDLWNEDHTRAFCNEENGIITIGKFGPSPL